jgi:predicted transposase YbfD/YdcC
MRKTFLSYFCTIKDHRINRKKRHSLENIIAITIVSTICGAETWEEVSFYGEVRKNFFSKFLDLRNGIPSKDTFRRFFAALDPEVFEFHFLQWTRSLVKDIDKEFVSIDGKMVRQASRMREDNPIHLVSAWASANELILGQLKVAEKSNEITAIPALLEALFLKGATVTIDAMGCQKEIAKKIVEKEADYVLALKDNHPALLEDVMRSFDKKPCHNVYQTLDFGHGRIEERKCSIITDLNYILDRNLWSNLHAVVRIDSQRILKKTGAIQQETRYYITSLTDVKKISKAIRSHWGIENKTHWCLDMVFGEDSSSKRAGFSAQNFSLINKIVLNLIRSNKDNDNERFKVKIGIKSKRKFAALDDDYLFELLNSI